ncbi:MAG: peptide ABC transporter substrate-binding protein [Opitutaceae bacterium]|nr:peptide ABC transporter substrate-binding protein [Opitutaceae bacterium]
MPSRFALLPLLFATFLTLTGCGGRQSRVEQGNADGVLHMAIGAEPRDLDPHMVSAYTDMQVVLALFEGLVAVDEATSRPVAAGAESWTIAPDGMSWTFQIRSDLRWSDGIPLTAETFRDSFRRALAPALASEYAYVLYAIRGAADFNSGKSSDPESIGVRAPDSQTLIIELEQPTPMLASILTLPVAFPAPLHMIESVGGLTDRANPWTRQDQIISNGPFRLTDWSSQSHIRTERNPEFRDATHVGLNGIVFYPYENAVSQEAAFRAGQLHLTSEVPLTKVSSYRKDSPEVLRVDPFVLTGFMRFNVTRPPLDDIRVRRALAMAIDREALTGKVMVGGEQPAERLTPPNTGGYTAAATLPHNPAQARVLLAEAGYPGGEGFPKMEVMSRAREINQSILEAVQQMWRSELGINVGIAMKEQRVWLNDETQLAYDISNARWIGDYVEPYTFLELFYSFSGNNNTGWANSRYDEVLKQAAAISDETTRYAAYQEAERILLEDAPIAPIYHGTQAYLIRPEVKGWPPALLGFHRYQFVRLSPSDSP